MDLNFSEICCLHFQPASVHYASSFPSRLTVVEQKEWIRCWGHSAGSNGCLGKMKNRWAEMGSRETVSGTPLWISGVSDLFRELLIHEHEVKPCRSLSNPFLWKPSDDGRLGWLQKSEKWPLQIRGGNISVDFLRVGSWGEATASNHQSWWKHVLGYLSDVFAHIQDNISTAGLILACHCYQPLHFHLVPLPSNHYTTLLF